MMSSCFSECAAPPGSRGARRIGDKMLDLRQHTRLHIRKNCRRHAAARRPDAGEVVLIGIDVAIFPLGWR